MIYLDNAASTKIHDSVLEEMLPYFQEQYGNPSSIHKYGRLSSKAVSKARKRVASIINADAAEVSFTSGGTESNNTVLYGFSRSFPKGRIVTSQIEHDAVLEPCKQLELQGYDVEYLPVDSSGIVDLDSLERSLDKNSNCLVSIMFANNEVGSIQPIKQISKICKTKGALFHTDAVQAIGKVPINVQELQLDFLSMSSHKINGPKGIGALYVNTSLKDKILPLIYGGGQEEGFRSGTENVANIVGFGKACEISRNALDKNISFMKHLRDTLIKKVLTEIEHVRLNGPTTQRLPNNTHFTFYGVNGEDLIIKLDENGIAASTGSACSVRTQKASHVLSAMGFSHEEITGSLRLTVGIYNNEDEITTAVGVLKKVVVELRQVSPFKEKYQFLSNRRT